MRSIWAATSRHAAARGHCDRHQLHYWKFLSDERLSANVPSALQRHLSGTLCQHLFWTVTLWHYLKLDLKLIFSHLFLANWLDLSASASEAIAPRRSTNRVLLLLVVVLVLITLDYHIFTIGKSRCHAVCHVDRLLACPALWRRFRCRRVDICPGGVGLHHMYVRSPYQWCGRQGCNQGMARVTIVKCDFGLHIF